MRFLIILLLLLNALALAAIRGGLGSAATRGEAERLAAQLAPERIRLAGDAVPQTAPAPAGGDTDTAPRTDKPATDGLPLPEQAGPAVAPPDEATGEGGTAGESASAAPPTPPGCLAWSGLGEEDATRLVTRLRQQGAEPVRHADTRIDTWWVRIPPARNRSAAELHQRSLHAQGIRDTFIVQEAGPSQFAISLGVFKTERRARQLREQLYAKGVRDAAIEPRTRTVYRVEARPPPAAMHAIESAADDFEQHRQGCENAPPNTD